MLPWACLGLHGSGRSDRLRRDLARAGGGRVAARSYEGFDAIGDLDLSDVIFKFPIDPIFAFTGGTVASRHVAVGEETVMRHFGEDCWFRQGKSQKSGYCFLRDCRMVCSGPGRSDQPRGRSATLTGAQNFTPSLQSAPHGWGRHAPSLGSAKRCPQPRIKAGGTCARSRLFHKVVATES